MLMFARVFEECGQMLMFEEILLKLTQANLCIKISGPYAI